MSRWQHEQRGDFLFRWRVSQFADAKPSHHIYAEAKRTSQPFVTDDCLTEPLITSAGHDLWFGFGATPEEVVGKLKREVLS